MTVSRDNAVITGNLYLLKLLSGNSCCIIAFH